MFALRKWKNAYNSVNRSVLIGVKALFDFEDESSNIRDDERFRRRNTMLQGEGVETRQQRRQTRKRVENPPAPTIERQPNGCIMRLIWFNMVVWSIGITTAYLAVGASLIQAVGIFVVLWVMMLITLALQFLAYKFYWYLVAFQWTVASLSIAGLILAMITGSIAIDRIMSLIP